MFYANEFSRWLSFGIRIHIIAVYIRKAAYMASVETTTYQRVYVRRMYSLVEMNHEVNIFVVVEVARSQTTETRENRCACVLQHVCDCTLH